DRARVPALLDVIEDVQDGDPRAGDLRPPAEIADDGIHRGSPRPAKEYPDSMGALLPGGRRSARPLSSARWPGVRLRNPGHPKRVSEETWPPCEQVATAGRIPGRSPLPGVPPCQDPANTAPMPPRASPASTTCPGPTSASGAGITAAGPARGAATAPTAIAGDAGLSMTS